VRNATTHTTNSLTAFSGHRFHFNGQEADNEVAGSGNSYTAEFWQYDSRLGRRWNVDPITYPWQSSYAVFNNCPITLTDINGLFAEDPTEPTGNDPVNKLPNTSNEKSIEYEMKEVTVLSSSSLKPKLPEKNTSSLLKRIGNFISNSFNWLKNRWGIMFSSENGGKIGGARKATSGMDVDVIPFEAVEAIKLSMPWLINGNKGYKPSKPTDADLVDPIDGAIDASDSKKESNNIHAKSTPKVDTIYKQFKEPKRSAWRTIYMKDGDSIGGAYYTGNPNKK
jgi:hypothetical protein